MDDNKDDGDDNGEDDDDDDDDYDDYGDDDNDDDVDDDDDDDASVVQYVGVAALVGLHSLLPGEGALGGPGAQALRHQVHRE